MILFVSTGRRDPPGTPPDGWDVVWFLCVMVLVVAVTMIWGG